MAEEKEIWAHGHIQKEDDIKTRGIDGYLPPRKRSLKRNQRRRYLDLKSLASRVWRKEFLLVKPLTLWWLVMAL